MNGEVALVACLGEPFGDERVHGVRQARGKVVLDLAPQGPPHAWLFGEDASRAVISFSPGHLKEIEKLCARHLASIK